MGKGLRREHRGQETEAAGVKVGRRDREPDQGQGAIKETAEQIEVRRQESEVGDQKSEIRSRRSEVRDQKSEVREIK